MDAVFAKVQDETFQVTQAPVYQNSTMLQTLSLVIIYEEIQRCFGNNDHVKVP